MNLLYFWIDLELLWIHRILTNQFFEICNYKIVSYYIYEVLHKRVYQQSKKVLLIYMVC